MYEEDDGEYPVYEDDDGKPRRRRKLFGGTALLVYAVIGAGLAQTITLNGNGTVEFVQGVVQIIEGAGNHFKSWKPRVM